MMQTEKEFYMRLVYLSLIFIISSVSFLQAADRLPGCYRDLQVNFFESKAVMEAFSMHYIPQNMWAPLVRALQVESQRVPEMIRAQGMQMRPNPLDPFDAGPAMDILRNSLFAVFTEVLNSYNYNQDLKINQGDIVEMFNYISNKQAYRIDRCFGRVSPETSQNPNQSTTINIVPDSSRSFDPIRPVNPSRVQQSPRGAPSPRAKNALPNPFDRGY